MSKLSLTSWHQGSAGFCSDTERHITVLYHHFSCHVYSCAVQQGSGFLLTCGLDELWILPKNKIFFLKYNFEAVHSKHAKLFKLAF